MTAYEEEPTAAAVPPVQPMTDDELLEALARAARERDPAGDPRLDRLVRGKLSDVDRAALGEQAAASETAREAQAAFEPLPARSRDRFAESLRAALARPKHPGPVPADAGRAGAPSPAPEPAPAPAPVVPLVTASRAAPAPARDVRQPFPRSRRAGWAAALGSIALAACLAAILLLRPASHAALPAYAIEVAGGAAAVQGEPASDAADTPLPPDARLFVTLRPATRVHGAVSARAFLVREGRALPWRVPLEITREGLVVLRGSREELFAGVPAGAWEILFLVGRPDSLPQSQEAPAAELHELASRSRGDLAPLVHRVILTEAGPGERP